MGRQALPTRDKCVNRKILQRGEVVRPLLRDEHSAVELSLEILSPATGTRYDCNLKKSSSRTSRRGAVAGGTQRTP